MKMMADVNGVSVPVEVDLTSHDEQVANGVLYDLFRELCIEAHDKYTWNDEERLDEDEFMDFVNNALHEVTQGRGNVHDFIVQAVFDNCARDFFTRHITEVINNRAHVYCVDVSYSGSFEIRVRARSRDDAIEYVENMSSCDLTDYFDTDDADYDVDCAIESHRDPESYDVDATED